jgi:Family of unknown function (DUF6011)
MKCFNCKGDHDTVAQCRECHGAAVVTHRPNKYAGLCVRCGAEVPEMAGRIDKNAVTLKWDVSHLGGQCPERPAPTAEKRPSTTAKKAGKDLDSIVEGYYAVDSLTGNNDLDFFKVVRPTEGRWEGYIFVKRVIGGNPEAPVRGATREAALVAILVKGSEKSRMLYGQEIGNCGDCGRSLTDDESRARGIGPVCWARH